MPFAQAVADNLSLFDSVIASSREVNLAGAQKEARLTAEFGDHGFDYAGNSRADLAVWAHARRAILVNPGFRVRELAKKSARVSQEFNERNSGVGRYLNALRIHQWLKNLLVFIPLLTAHGIKQ